MNRSTHFHTPSVQVRDPRTLIVRQVDYLRATTSGKVERLITCQTHDAAARLVAKRDPRLSEPNLTTLYSLNGDPLKIDSVDSGWRLVLPGLAGEPRQRWDERGHCWQSTFDEQLRVVQLELTGNGDSQLDTFTYAPGSAKPDSNLRGQLIRQTDSSGSLDITSYALTGQLLVEKRTFHDDAAFTSHQVFSPLGAVLEQIDAGGHRRVSRYGLAGQLKQVELEVKTKVTQVLLDVQYNANDQIISQLDGNEVLSQWTYDPADGRLRTRTSQKPDQPRLQDLEYFYDRVGNITRIEDHAFEPVWFANQRVDGHREFSYDSLYRLIRATGHDDALPPDIPGLPQPPDERNRLNYTQTYTYDDGGNLTELRHQRDGNSRTRTLCIDDKSNRGVRWETGDEPPDFGAWFDPHGNQRRLHHGPSLHWNGRDELEHIDLVLRKDSANDAEHYRYSQGVRVFKRHETFAPGANHFHQVRYLPGLEIRTRDNGEELHVISLGNARCLHWVTTPPVANNQLRYTLQDHLGSCVMELDEKADVTSAEGYYPFGETAWMKPESETVYRFIRYSGKEMDVSGLYYYGARYYAPWLQRWVSADPAGDVDGLNLYAMVSNNPLLYVDTSGYLKSLANSLRGLVGMTKNVSDSISQLHEFATKFDALIPEGAAIDDARENLTFRKFIFSRYGLRSIYKGGRFGAAVGTPVGGVIGGLLGFPAGAAAGAAAGALGGGFIGGLVGGVIGAIAIPVMRYYFFKKGLKLTEVMHTEELNDGAQAISDAVQSGADLAQKVMDGASDLADDASTVLNGIKRFNETLSSYPQRLQDMFYNQLDVLSGEKQREIMKLVRSGIDPFEAIDQALETAKQLVEEPSEADGVTDRLQQLEQSIAAEPRTRPVAKPRSNLVHRRQVRETAV